MLENCKRLICSPSLNKVYCIVLYYIVLYCIVIKFRYNARSDWLKQRALSEYRCTE